MALVTREQWGAKDPKATNKWTISNLFGVTVHHFASPRHASTPAGSAALMRGVQAGHMAPGGLGAKDGGNDIAYNFCFDDFGDIYIGRGWPNMTGANGTTFANLHYLAFCYMGHSDLDPFSEKAQDSCALLISQAFKKGVDREVVPHKKWTGSSCPGNRGLAWVTGGGWKKDLPTVKRVRFELWDDARMITKSEIVPISQSAERWHDFEKRVSDKAHALLAAEGERGSVQFRRRVLS